MKQLIKNELIKLRAQKTYLVLSCIVLALVVLVCFFTSVAMTPFMNFMNNGREFLTRSAAYEAVVDFIYQNPDHALTGVLRTLFRDPKSEGDEMREEAEYFLEMEMYGYCENMLAMARYYDFRDANDLPEWVSTQFQGTIVDLYRWQAIVKGLQSGKYTEEIFMYDYYMQEVMSPTFAEFPYYMEYVYDHVTGMETYRYYHVTGGECSFDEVVAGLAAALPACESEIARAESAALAMDADVYYASLLLQVDAKVQEKEQMIAQLRLALQDPAQMVTDEDREYCEYQIETAQGQIEDYERQGEGFRYLKEQGIDPESHAFEIVNIWLPRTLSLRRDAITTIAAGELSEEFDLMRVISKSSAKHQIRVLDKALIAMEYAYEHNVLPEGMGQSTAKATFVNNLSTAAFLISAVTVVLASMILSREFATGTVRLWVIRPKTRSKLLGSKIVALFIYVVSMMLVCFGITYVFALANHLIDLFFYGESTLFAPVYGVVFGMVIPIPAVLEHLWALVVITLPVLLFAMLCLFISVLTKKGVLGIVLGMIVLMFASDIQAISLIVANLTGGFGYLLHATVLPYLSMDALLGSALDFAISAVGNSLGLMDILNLEALLMSELWGAMPYVCSSLVGAIVLIVHIVLLILASLFAFKRTQIKS